MSPPVTRKTRKSRAVDNEQPEMREEIIGKWAMFLIPIVLAAYGLYVMLDTPIAQQTSCFALQTDRRHCGAMHHACEKDQVCCAGECAALARNTSHCGACDVMCDAAREEICVNGRCVRPIPM